jgi:hypothetical protein
MPVVYFSFSSMTSDASHIASRAAHTASCAKRGVRLASFLPKIFIASKFLISPAILVE